MWIEEKATEKHRFHSAYSFLSKVTSFPISFCFWLLSSTFNSCFFIFCAVYYNCCSGKFSVIHAILLLPEPKLSEYLFTVKLESCHSFVKTARGFILHLKCRMRRGLQRTIESDPVHFSILSSGPPLSFHTSVTSFQPSASPQGL